MTVLMWRAAGERWKRERWWKLNSHRFPVLASFVKAVLCVPATSTTTTTTKEKISVTLHKKLQGHCAKLQSALCRSHWKSSKVVNHWNDSWNKWALAAGRKAISDEAALVCGGRQFQPVLQPRETRDRQEYRVRQNKVAPSIFCGFLSNRVEFQRKILRTYLVIICAFNSHITIL